MKFLEEAKQKTLKKRAKSEKGSVTLFVLIAMLFFLTVLLAIYFTNVNTSTTQQKDMESIQTQYNGVGDLDRIYQEEKVKYGGGLIVSVVDSNNNIYSSTNENNDIVWLKAGDISKLPLTVDVTWPEGATKKVELSGTLNTADGPVTPHIVIKENHIETEKTSDLRYIGNFIQIDKDCDIKIKATANEGTAFEISKEVLIKIDITAPQVSINSNSEIIWQLPGEERTGKINATMSATDNLTQIQKLQYIIDHSSSNPASDANWNDYESTIDQSLSAGEGTYYLHAKATDKAGNEGYSTSGPYAVKIANYELKVGSTTTYAENLKEAVETTGVNNIKALQSLEDSSTAIIGTDVTIDTNRFTVTMANTITVAANKTVTFVDTAATKGKIERTTGQLITNNGTVKVGTNSTNGANMDSADCVIYGVNANVEVNSGKLNVTGAGQWTTNYTAIWAANITINGGEVINGYMHYAIIANGQSTINITGGKIKGKNWGIHNGSSNGILNISGDAEITGGNHGIISYSNNANITMTGGTVSGVGSGIYIYYNSNTVNIKGGTITGGQYGISTRPESSGHTITIGDNTTALDRTTPVIQGTSDYSVAFPSSNTSSTFNYYDGKLIGGKHDRTYSGRDVTFSVLSDTINVRTEKEGEATRYYRPYTRQNTTTNLYETVLEKQVNVTFNPNCDGVTVAESNRNVLTNVEYKEIADTAAITSLPTPKREGYTFKGWRYTDAKNLFDEESILMAIDGATKENGYYVFHPKNGDKAYGRITGDANSNVGDKNMNISFKENTQYTLSLEGYTDYIQGANVYQTFFIGFFYTDGTSNRVDIYGSQSKVLTSTYGKTISRIAMSYGRSNDGANVHIKYIQLEEGDTATAYEPYYIVDNTKVARDQDHILNATWEANEYTVTANANDGTIASTNGWTNAGDNKTATKQIKYDSAYGDLPTPTRSGYTFLGWYKTLLNLQVPESTPSDTAHANTTKRTFEFNTYVKNLAYDNYYMDRVRDVSITGNKLSFKTSSGYGVGFPLKARPNTNYVLSYNGITNQNMAISSVMFYKEDGTLINYIRTNGNGSKIVEFNTPDDMYYLVIEFNANGFDTDVTFSNILLTEGTAATAYESTRLTSDSIYKISSNSTIYAKWIKFNLNRDNIALQTNTTTKISPSGTEGAKITYTGEGIEELAFESENTGIATVAADGTIKTSSSASTGSNTKIIIKDKATGIKLGEVTVIIDLTPPQWVIKLFSIT